MADALDTLLTEMTRLLEEQADAPTPRGPGEGNFRCQRCEGCNDCRFCTDCTDCIDCTYCDACVACSGCTQSKLCRDCERTSHSQLSRACDDCSYLTLCVGCEQCVHCFGCVALSGAEFCILNEKLSRKEYQTRIAELRVALERRLVAGWRPSWLGDEDEGIGVAAPAPELGVLDRELMPAVAEPFTDGTAERSAVPTQQLEDVTVPLRGVSPEAPAASGAPSVTRGARPPRAEAAALRSSVLAARRPVRR